MKRNTKQSKKLTELTVVILLTACIFGGCAKVPETLSSFENDGIDTINSETQLADYTQNSNNNTERVDRGTLENIRNQLESDLNKMYKNIKIENARVGDGSVMPTYDIKIGKNPNFDFKNLIEYLYAENFDINNDSFYTHKSKGDPMDKNYPATTEPAYSKDGIKNPNVMNYDLDGFAPAKDDDYTLSTYAYSTGNIFGSETGGGLNNDYYWFEAFKIYERYDLKYNKPDENLSYKMTDGNDWNTLEAISFVENFWNNNLSVSDPQKYEYSIKTLFVIQLGEDIYGYLFEIERRDENGNYLDVDCGYIQDDAAIESGNPFKVGNEQTTWCNEKNVITRFVKNFSFNYENQTDDGNALLTLGKAADILSESLAPNIDLDINSAELNYVVVCKGYPFFQIWEYPWYYESVCIDRCDFEIKPYWCFRTDKSTLMRLSNCEIYFIDAVSGELSVMKY